METTDKVKNYRANRGTMRFESGTVNSGETYSKTLNRCWPVEMKFRKPSI